MATISLFSAGGPVAKPSGFDSRRRFHGGLFLPWGRTHIFGPPRGLRATLLSPSPPLVCGGFRGVRTDTRPRCAAIALHRHPRQKRWRGGGGAALAAPNFSRGGTGWVGQSNDTGR